MEARLKKVRLNSGLSMAKFAEKIGVTAPSVSRLESGVNSPADRTIMLICSQFSISEQWLRYGDGDMYAQVPDDPVESLVERYNLTDLDRSILEAYIELDPASRSAVSGYFRAVHDKLFASEIEADAANLVDGHLAMIRQERTGRIPK